MHDFYVLRSSENAYAVCQLVVRSRFACPATRWLAAQLYVTEFRPVPLRQFVKEGLKIKVSGVSLVARWLRLQGALAFLLMMIRHLPAWMRLCPVPR